ncbi:hypothetical protein [Actinomyces israelii]|uniref:hypothetical protein n=1 Tax=Actinomyces israelii TaxID=1659 RepID=UPI000AC371C4|nr:hypothetical protein [Actinomyces israelii]
MFICGDHYLLLSVNDMRELHSDIRTDLVNLTQSALPGLCQGRPTPSQPPTPQPHTP